jgi:hypothetical protein
MCEQDGKAFTSREARGHLCSISGALWSPHGRIFDGVDDQITLAGIPFVNGRHTFIWWMKSSHSSGNVGIFSTTTVLTKRGLNLINTTPLFVQTNSGFKYFTSVSSYLDDNWHFWEFYLPGATQSDYKASILRIDGTEIPGGATGDDIPSVWTTFTIGQSEYGNIAMTMGDFLVYNRGLSAAEASCIWQITKWRYQ